MAAIKKLNILAIAYPADISRISDEEDILYSTLRLPPRPTSFPSVDVAFILFVIFYGV